jgi:predicted small secreted protein
MMRWPYDLQRTDVIATCVPRKQSEGTLMRTNPRVWLALAVLVAAAPVLSACNTTRGAGEDLSAAGKSLQNSAERNTSYKP